MKTRSSYSSILFFELNYGDRIIVVYYDSKNKAKHLEGVFDKVKRDGDSGVLYFQDGLELLIDKIISVNGDISPNYADEFDGCSCR